MKGRGTGKPHRSRRDEQRIPVFRFDYLSATEASDSSASAVECKVFVAHCTNTKCVFAHVVPQKGIDPDYYAVERLVRDIKWLGHTWVILK